MKHLIHEAAERLKRPDAHVHMLGVCGVGMAGVAALLQARGFRVSGCDASPNRLADWLRDRGISVLDGHSPAHAAPDVDWVVRSTAVPEDNPEVAAFAAAGKPVFRRGVVLPALLHGRTSISVSGTHGKTTTTTFITRVLKSAGLNPGFCIGGEVAALGGVAGAGGNRILVVEADESDGTAALYEPDIAVITNIEFDHMEHFESVAAFEDCFRRLMANARRRIVYCQDDPRASALASGLPLGVSYGFSAGADIRGAAFREDRSGISCAVFRGEAELGRISVPAPGFHNALNSLAVVAVGLEMGLSFDQIRDGLAGVELPKRRFDVVVQTDDIAVVSDYAHHPSEIAALIRAARSRRPRRLVAVFQPHRFPRTLALGRDFPRAFDGVDDLVLVPVYAASEKPLPGGSVWDLYVHFREQARQNVRVASSLSHAWAYYRRQLRTGDLFLVVGAGDVERVAEWAGDAIGRSGLQTLSPVGAWRRELAALPLRRTELRELEPLADKTTMGVGGLADVWAAVGDDADLALILRWCRRQDVPFHLIGAGSNLLVSDLGAPGVTARLTGPAFHGIRRQGEVVVAGAGVPLRRLADYLQENGLGGLEFLEGIPGTVGGAIRMNAGAWGREIGETVEWIRALSLTGFEETLSSDQLHFGYRSFAEASDRIVLEAAFRCPPESKDAIRARRAEHAARRAWMKGLRSAGSAFKNPRGAFAGRLIEEAGLKGRTVGGAILSPLHANVIVAGEGARASDVQALLELAREKVRQRHGVDLELEIAVLE